MNLLKSFLKTNVTNILMVILLCFTLYNSYFVYKIRQDLDYNTLVLTDSITAAAFDTNGKLDNLSKKTDIITNQKNTVVQKQVISYVEKTSKDDADVEIKTETPNVSVSVNGNKKYNFDILPTESSKMENGKLVITQGYSTDINIKSNEYKRSKWSITTAMNKDKDVLGGLHYDIGHSVSASIYTGQNIKPYYGFTYRIGGHE